MAAPLEQILAKLLVPDNAIIQEATLELKEAFKNPEILVELCRVICASENPQVRQYAAILLRKKIFSRKQWSQVSVDLRNGIKRLVLERLLIDNEKLVRTAIAQLCGTVAKHEFRTDSWPELMQFVQEYVKNPDPKARELAMCILSAIASSASTKLIRHLIPLFNLFATTLQDTENKMVIVYTIRTLTSLIYLVDVEEKPLIQSLIPRMTMLMKEFLAHDEEYTREVLEFFDEVVESDVSILIPHIKSVMEICLEIAGDQDLQQSTQIKAMNFVSWLTRLKKKTILKHKLIDPILNALFPIMCQTVPEDDDEEVMSSESDCPATCAAQVIDIMALHLPAEKLVPPLLTLVESALQSDHPYAKKAAYISIAVIAEGCAEFIRSKYLHPFLQSVCKGLTDSNTVVRNAAFFALGQFSEYLQPDISKYASELLPLLLEYLVQTSRYLQQDDRQPPGGTAKMFYAIEMFCENLDSDILPYLPTLMETLMMILTTTKSVSIRELAIDAIGAAAHAAKEEMLPYFQPILSHLRLYLTSGQPEHLTLQVQALDTLAVLARTIGEKNFAPLCEECMQLGLDLIGRITDPDLKRSIYGLFTAVAAIQKEEMTRYLPSIIPHMITSLRSVDGFVTHYKSDTENFLNFGFDDENEESLGDEDTDDDEYDDGGDCDDDDEDEEDVSGYVVENAYNNEKEDVCQSLREISEYVQEGFLPYLQECNDELFKFIDYPSSSVKKTAVEALAQFCCTLHKVSVTHNSIAGKETLQLMVDKLLPQTVEIIENDLDRETVMGALEAVTHLTKTLEKTLFENQDHLEAIVRAANNVMIGEVACQDQGENEDKNGKEGEAEYDSMLIEFAGEVITTLPLAVPPESYNPLFENFLQMVSPKLKKNRTVPERSFAAGSLAQSCENMKENVKPFASRLLPLFLSTVRDEHQEVRANAIFGLGVLAEHGKEVLFDQYQNILQTLSAALARETYPRPTDNICGAVARLIMTNVHGVPMDQVFPVMVKCLPLKEDLEENHTIFRCFLYLINMRHPELPKYFPDVFKVCAFVVNNKQINEETKNIMIQMLRTTQQEYPQEFQAVSSSLPNDVLEVLRITVV